MMAMTLSSRCGVNPHCHNARVPKDIEHESSMIYIVTAEENVTLGIPFCRSRQSLRYDETGRVSKIKTFYISKNIEKL